MSTDPKEVGVMTQSSEAQDPPGSLPLLPLRPRAQVPCNGCTVCCRNETVRILPQYGDDPTQYSTMRVRIRETGEIVTCLKQNPDRSCVYLGPQGCTIWDKAPYTCRTFDCRAFSALFSAAERKFISKRAPHKKEIFDAARRLNNSGHSLGPRARAQASPIPSRGGKEAPPK